MTRHGPTRKVSSSLVALSSAAIITVYAAGYVRTKHAADRFDLEDAARRRSPPPRRAAAPTVPASSSAQPPALGTPAAVATAAQPPAGLSPATATPEPPEPPAVKLAVAFPVRSVGSPVAAATIAPRDSSLATPSPAPRPSAPSTPSPAPKPTATSTPLREAPAKPAPSPPAAAPVEEAVDGDVASPATGPALYVDGVYTGWGSCRHGDLQVELTVQGGRIAWASIAKCYTRYPCSWIDRLVPEVVANQGPPVTFISGASDSSDALYYAVLDALSKAK